MYKPIVYKRYVDDIFALFSEKNKAELFLEHINGVHPNIKFTVEEENNRNLTFLDVSITRHDRKFETGWYLKSTNTGIYLHKNAFSPQTYKAAAIRSLIYRAYKICSSRENFEHAFQSNMHFNYVHIC